ncbi:hypothetical protein EJB05_47086, partial [Eragrostis curvula]
MAGSRSRQQLKRQRGRTADDRDLRPAKRTPDVVRVNFVRLLPQDLLAKIHGRLTFLDRLAFAVVCSAAGHPMNLEDTPTPWIVFPGKTKEKATFFSLADSRAAAARTSDLGMRGHIVLGSSFGWLATADEFGGLQIVNPVTGQHTRLPDIATIPFLDYSLAYSKKGGHYCLNTELFHRTRYGGLPVPIDEHYGSMMPQTSTLTGYQMRHWFYRKVILSASPRLDSYAAMLILHQNFGVPAFATSDHPTWKVAPSVHGIEDAIHHDGRFYSISSSGAVEAWERDCATGEYTSKLVAVARVNMVVKEEFKVVRKYIAAMPDGRLVVLLKYTWEKMMTYNDPRKWSCVFKVQMLDEARRRWKETRDIGDAALFVGMSSSFCVSTAAAHTGIKPGCVYFADDQLEQAAEPREWEANKYGPRSREDENKIPEQAGVYSLKDGTVELVQGLARQPWSSPPVWFTPSF